MNLQDWTHRTWQVLDRRPARDIDRHYTHSEVATVLDAAIEALAGELVAGGLLRLHSLGMFTVVDTPERPVISRFSGEERTHLLPVRRRVRFSPSRRLTQQLNVTGGSAVKASRKSRNSTIGG